jgi:PAS domain S-box-containing protein
MGIIGTMDSPNNPSNIDPTALSKRKTELLYEQLPFILLGTIMAAGISASLLWSSVSHKLIFIWVGLHLLVTAFRIAISYFYTRSDTETPHSLNKWLWLFMCGIVLSGITWGLMWPLLLSSVSSNLQMISLSILGAVLFGSIWSYGISISAYLMFLFPIIIPLGISLSTGAYADNNVGVALAIAFYCFSILFLIRTHKTLSNMLLLEFKNIQLSKEWTRENEERKGAENALAANETLFIDLVENATDMIYRINIKGDFTFVNPIASKITGYSTEELTSMNYLDLIREDYHKKAKIFYLKQYKKGDANSYFDYPILTKDGKELWIAQNTQLILNNEEISAFQSVARDITEIKKIEEELLQAKQEAEEAQKAEEEFLANVSHDMRTPLNAVVGITNLLQQTELTPEQKEYANSLSVSSYQLLGIINDLLDLSKIEKGHIEFIETHIKIKDLTDSIVGSFKAQAEQKQLALNVIINEEIPAVILGDRKRLEQILLNLISNAIKFTDSGEINIEVNTISEQDDSVTLKFNVKDTGIGIPEAHIKNIFQEFKQAYKHAHKDFEGTGLGLAIVKKLVELQDGEIFLVSTEGKGSTFGFILTFKKYLSTAKLDVSGEYLITKEDAKKHHILLVDDNEMNIFVALKQLKNVWPNMNIDTATNGQEAIDKISQIRYDLVLMDIQMPIMDGYEASRYIRDNMDKPANEIPIIALTAGLAPKEKLLAAGINDFLLKPFQQKDLINKIRGFIEHTIAP